MDDTDADARIFLSQMVRKMLGAIHRAVLTSRTAETNHQIGKTTLAICLYMRIYNTIYMLQKAEHFPIILQELYYRLVTSRQLLI